MADGGEGFVGRMDIVDPRRGYRQWSTEMKARIVAESLQAGFRVVDVARRYDLAANQLSDWRKRARDGLLTLPAELKLPAVASRAPETVKATAATVSIEIGADLVVKVPVDVAVSRVAALVRAMRGLA